MKRFLVLFRDDNGSHWYAEGLSHYDGAVYVRGLPEQSKFYPALRDLENALRDNERISNFIIQMIDE